MRINVHDCIKTILDYPSMPASDIDSYITIFKINVIIQVIVHDIIIFKPNIIMKQLTIQDKIQILKDAIKYLKEYKCTGMCIAIYKHLNNYTFHIVSLSTLDYYYPDFTHDNYLKFYRFNKTVKRYKDCAYWDDFYNVFGINRRIIFLRYLILKLRIQQFKQ